MSASSIFSILNRRRSEPNDRKRQKKRANDVCWWLMIKDFILSADYYCVFVFSNPPNASVVSFGGEKKQEKNEYQSLKSGLADVTFCRANCSKFQIVIRNDIYWKMKTISK